MVEAPPPAGDGLAERNFPLIRAELHTELVIRLTGTVTIHTLAAVPPTTPRDIQLQRAIEDRAIALGVERARLEELLANNTGAVGSLVREWEKAGSPIPFERLASLVGVSRQTLYRWREPPAA
jgi:hypothetical protein